MKKTSTNNSIHSIFKAFRLIELFGAPNYEYSLSEINKKLEISMGSVQRITNSLMELGYLVKDKKTKKFRLSPKWLPIGFGILAGLEIRKVALPHMKQLYLETGETISLVIRDGEDVIYVERLITQDLIGFNIRAGLRRPMYPNSMGKAILAFLPADEQEEVLQRMNIDAGEQALNIKEIIAELDRIKQQGYAINQVRSSIGALAISVPILNRKGDPVAGINIGTPSNHPLDEKKFQKYFQLLMNTGRTISSELGFIDYQGE
ncbi:MAG: IclR family transcriptional regulator [Desulfobacterium sp.]|nr:IclR family transcriptional regulator [Desulfobacteraceae bacterium]MBA3037428.1 IclR family transcriptional regulator [Desulfobacterium sp.]